MDWLTGLLIFVLIFFLNSVFVIAEIALLTSRKAILQKTASNGSIAAKKLLHLYKNPEKLLSTVLIGITSVGVISGLIGGGTIAGELEKIIAIVPFLNQYSSPISEILTVIVVVFITVSSELIPKRVALLNPEKAAMFTSYIVIFFYYLFYPFMQLLSTISNWVLKLLKIEETKQSLSIEEFKILLQQVEGHGNIESTGAEMIKRLLNLGDMQVGAVMTPRSQMVYIDIKDSELINKNKIINNPFNYFPVTDGGLPKILGMVSAKQFLNSNITTANLLALAKPIIYIPEMAKLNNLMTIFKEKQLRIAMVIDEYGDIEGLVTVNDILKTFVGDLATLVEGQKPTVQKKKNGSYAVSGSISVEEVMEIMQVGSLPGDEEEEYRTLASFILKQMNNVPKVNDQFKALGWNFKVIGMDKFRITKVLMFKDINK
jgi:putative hemolysin